MYEDTTYGAILDRMMRVANEGSPGIDTRQSSPVYASLAPAAVEIQNAYIELDWALDQMFAETAAREYLIRRCKEWGLAPHPATKAVLKGEFNIDVEIGSRFSQGTLNFVAAQRIDRGIYRMECETAGTAGNRGLGTMVPIDYIRGLTSAELTEVLEEGSDEESTEALLNRFLVKARQPSTSGNKHDYYNWAMECEGVGAAKVFPLAFGPGTVKVVVADAGMSAASEALLNSVKGHVEELRPIGADVTVASAAERAVNVSARVYLEGGASLGAAQNAFQAALEGYLQGNAFALTYVSLAHIGSLLLGTAGIADYGRLQLNGMEDNVRLGQEEIAVPGAVTLEVDV